MNRKIVRIILILVVVCAIAALAYNKVKKDQKQAAERKSMTKGSKGLLVDAYVVRPVPLQNNLEVTGTLLSNESIVIQPETTGRITQINFKEGSYVKKGDLLVELFDGDLKAQLEKSKIQQQLADTTLKRQKQLLAINGISEQNVDNTQNQVASAQADINYYKAEISKTDIRAPFDGTVGLRQVSVGAIVTPSTVITNLYQNNPLKLQFSVPEKYRDRISLGDKVSFSVSEMHDRSFSGEIYAIDPGVDPVTRTVTMRALVGNNKNILAPGGFAVVHIDLHHIPDALMIPSQALIPTTQDAQVIVSRNGKAAFVTVQTGERTADQVQIISGLNAGDTVLTTGIMQAMPGASLHFMHVSSDEK